MGRVWAGEAQGVEGVQKNPFGKYSVEGIGSTTTEKSLESKTLWQYLRSYTEKGS